MSWKETPIGIERELNGFLLFFGKRDANLAAIQKAYPKLRWARIKQTHSDIVLESPQGFPEADREADGHWSRAKNLGLVIATADCTPVILTDARTGACSAIHAGWRGVASRISAKAAGKMIEGGSRAQDLRAFIGPHIEFASFEVQADVRDQLLASVAQAPEGVVRSVPGDRYLVNLTALVEAQLREAGVASASIARFDADTKTDLRFHSHRRDREHAGRQLSFVASMAHGTAE